MSMRQPMTLLEHRRRAVALLIERFGQAESSATTALAEIRRCQDRLRLLIESDADRASPYRWVDAWSPPSPGQPLDEA